MKKSKTLTSRLIRGLLLTFLPINILAVLVSGIYLYNMSEELKESRYRELSSDMSNPSEDIETVNEAASAFLSNYLAELTLAGDGDEIANIQMAQKLWEGFGHTKQTGFIYLYDRSNHKVYVHYSNEQYRIDYIERVKKWVEKKCSMEDTSAAVDEAWKISNVQNHYFFNTERGYHSYQVGFFFDIEYLLGETLNSPMITKGGCYLSDGNSTYVYRDKQLYPVTDSDWDQLFVQKRKETDTIWSDQNSSLKVGIKGTEAGFDGRELIIYWIMFMLSLSSIVLLLFMWRVLKSQVISAIQILEHAIKEIEQEHMEYRIDTANEEATGEFQYLYEHFNEMADEIVVSRQREVKLYEMQLDNLRLQINPHMLLNSFNMIYGLAQSKNYECIQEYALLLAEYFRYALKETDRFVPLKKEMDFVENYIAIQKLRFPNTFTSAYHVSEECINVLIPPLLIENFVENSMKYASIPGKVIEVLINIRKENDRLLISIIDTGRGMKPEVYAALQTGEVYVDKNNKRHIGVWNCRRRLEVFYHGEAKMNIISMPNQGTQIWLDLPFTTEYGENRS